MDGWHEKCHGNDAHWRCYQWRGCCEIWFCNRAYNEDILEDEVLKIAEKIAKIPSDLEQMNKRSVHCQMELMGMRAAIRQGTEIQALAFHTKSTRAHFKELAAGLTDALSSRDGKFGDYRTSKKED